jgi:penicillin-binding protein 1C
MIFEPGFPAGRSGWRDGGRGLREPHVSAVRRWKEKALPRLDLRGLVVSLVWTLTISTLASFLLLRGDARFPDLPSLAVTDRDGELLRVYLNNRQQWCLPLEEGKPLPEKLIQAARLYEDRNFFYHPGVDPLALVRALFLNLRRGQRISGASTLTMQVARLMQPKPRTVGNKIREILAALRLELLYPKERILRFYLDNAPYGGNIVGVQTASYRYFGKPAEHLTWAEAALLAVLPNAPYLLRAEDGWAALREKRDRLLERLEETGFLDGAGRRLAVQEPLPSGETSFPQLAPHLAERMRIRVENTAAEGGYVRTTLDLDLQRRVEEVTAFHASVLSRLGIHNTAVLVVENRSGKARAYVGSQDWNDVDHNGQVDGVSAVRSTGSLLKPFLYALAMDEGAFLPRTLIRDVPSHYGPFTPQNPDLRYNGLVSVREALIRSLNVPAVHVLQEYGLQRFYRFLLAAGVTSLFRTAQDYGLPLVLGGAEASLIELTALYRGLAMGGSFSPLSFTEAPDAAVSGSDAAETDPDAAGSGDEVRLISPGACYLTLEVLKDLNRPGAEYYWESYAGSPPLAWKTGTSFGQKDGWAIGVNPRWTLGIWIGNFTGEGNANLKSSRCAGPLLFDIFRILPKETDGEAEWFKPPADSLEPVELCLKTGYRAGPYCGETVYSLAPAHSRPLPVCPYHRQIYVTTDETYRVNSLCWESGDTKTVSRLIYPPEVAQFLRERGQQLDEIPPFKPECIELADLSREAGTPLRIVYPDEQALLWIPRDLDGDYQKITLRAAHSEAERAVFWYIYDVYQGLTREAHSRSMLLSKGWHDLELVDESGYRASRRFYVDIR